METNTEAHDVLIIGTGAGGILILERGDFLPQETQNRNTAEVFLENRYHTSEVGQRSDGKPLIKTPLAGSLFAVQTGFKGLLASPFPN